MLIAAQHAFVAPTDALHLAEACQRVAEYLEQAGFEADESRREARQLIRLATGYSLTQQVANPHVVLTAAMQETLERLAMRRAAREPFAYLEGCKEFMGLNFAVSPATLIPRPDSETLVEVALASMPHHVPLRVLDLGTGTGCLLLSVLHARPDAVGVGVDVSPEACTLAAHNASCLNLAPRAAFYTGDWWAALPADTGRFDVVLANPPYIDPADAPTLMPDVRNYEPHRALFAEEDGLREYRRILAGAAAHVRVGGLLILEVGHTQAARVEAMGIDAGFEAAGITQDLAGKARVVALRAPSRFPL